MNLPLPWETDTFTLLPVWLRVGLKHPIPSQGAQALSASS